MFLPSIYFSKKGIGTIVDIVLNHKAGGDDEKRTFQVYKVGSNNRQQNFISEPFEIESYTKFTFMEEIKIFRFRMEFHLFLQA